MIFIPNKHSLFFFLLFLLLFLLFLIFLFVIFLLILLSILILVIFVLLNLIHLIFLFLLLLLLFFLHIFLGIWWRINWLRIGVFNFCFFFSFFLHLIFLGFLLLIFCFLFNTFKFLSLEILKSPNVLEPLIKTWLILNQFLVLLIKILQVLNVFLDYFSFLEFPLINELWLLFSKTFHHVPAFVFTDELSADYHFFRCLMSSKLRNR